MHAQLLLVRPLARVRHVEGAQRLASPRMQSGPPKEKPLLVIVHRAQYLVGRASGRAGVGS